MSRLGAGVGAGIGGVVGALAGVSAAVAIEGGYERASKTNEDALLGMLGMLFGGIAGAAIGAGSQPEEKKLTVGTSAPPLQFRVGFP